MTDGSEAKSCKYCQSDSVIKYGKYKDTQYYLCKSCNKKFSNPDAIPKMQYSTSKVADAISMYFEGMSLKEIRRNFIQQHNDYISDVTVLNWVNRFTDLAVDEANKHTPNVGSVWVADETVIDIDGKNIWLWDIIDAKTRFLIATHMSYTRTSKDAEQLMKQAYKRTGKIPRVIYTDKLRAYLEGIESVFGGDTTHISKVRHLMLKTTLTLSRDFTVLLRVGLRLCVGCVQWSRLENILMAGWYTITFSVLI